MIIIGFSNKTHLALVRLVCGHWKHCAVVSKNANKFILHQFVSRRHIAKIDVTQRGVAQLESNGWVFILLQCKSYPPNINARNCVQYAKSVIGLKKFWIQTPGALYKYCKKNLT